MSPMNSNSSSASRRVLVIIALALFVVALLLVLITSFMPGSSRKIMIGGSYAEGYKAAREQAFQLGVPRIVATSLSGAVVSVSSNSLVLKTSLFLDKKVDGIGPERTILINGSTKIMKRVQKSTEQYQKEQKEFMDSIKNLDETKPGDAPMPPQPFTTVEARLSDIKAGDIITVATDGKEDLTLKDGVKAQTIEITPPVAPAVVPEKADLNK